MDAAQKDYFEAVNDLYEAELHNHDQEAWIDLQYQKQKCRAEKGGHDDAFILQHVLSTNQIHTRMEIMYQVRTWGKKYIPARYLG